MAKISHIGVQISLLIVLLCSLYPTYAAGERVALVIGNAEYKVSPLDNPDNDADSMSAALEKLGFRVIKGKNLSRQKIRESIRKFGKALRTAEVGLFYYAGHGIQYSGENYLIPVNADIQEEFEIKDEAISASSVLRSMENAGNPVNVVILDACRNNPFAKNFRSSSRGLLSMDGPNGSLIAFATGPGNVAADGSGENGLYTQHLLKYMNEPGLKLEEVFKKVRIAVSAETDGKQVPWEKSSLTGEFYFTGDITIVQPNVVVEGHDGAATNSRQSYELEFWNDVKSSPSEEMYQAYLEQYPEGTFARIALIKLKQYEPQVNVVEPAVSSLATLTVRSNVRGDMVTLNGVEQGATRLDLELEPGDYVIGVGKPGYQPFERTVSLSAGEEQTVYAKLSPVKTEQPALAKLSVVSNSQAQIYIDSVVEGATLLRKELPAGSYLIEVRKPGYQGFKKRVLLTAGSEEKVLAYLSEIKSVGSNLKKSSSGTVVLWINSNVKGQVRINGKEVGFTRLYRRLNPGNIRIKVTKPGYKEFQKDVIAKSGDKLNVYAKLTKLPKANDLSNKNSSSNTVVLWVNSNIKGKVTINGKHEGNTRLYKRLSPGKFRIEVTRSGYKKFQKELVVKSGDNLNVYAKLTKLPKANDLSNKNSSSNTVVLWVNSNVKGKVTINGKHEGNTRLYKRLSPGKFKIEVTKSGYKKFQKEFVVKSGDKLNIYAKLTK